jgi:3D (Asp-Asp-Asp) domain-containing protein
MEKEFELLERFALKALNYCLYGLVILYFTVWIWKPSGPRLWNENDPEPSYEIVTDEIVGESKMMISGKHKKIRVHVTVYNPVEAQCDSDPLITADNSEIDLRKLKRQKIRWAAVSRDLLADVKFGDKIRITGCKDKSLNGVWTVHDVMNARYQRRVDLLYHQDVRNYGSGKANLEFLRD